MEKEANQSKPVVHNIGDKVYVDDGRGWWFLFRPGTRYEDGRFVIKTDESSLLEDSEITLGEVTRREILKCLNDKNKNITFTVEKPDDYKVDNGNIPTLDFKIGINDDNTEYIMMFYEKPMASKYFTPADSAIGRVQRNQIVAYNITRMLRRMSPKLVIKESKELIRVLDNANNRLKYSGYDYYERLHIIDAGITNYKKRRRASKQKKERMFQTEGEAREKRDKKNSKKSKCLCERCTRLRVYACGG